MYIKAQSKREGRRETETEREKNGPSLPSPHILGERVRALLARPGREEWSRGACGWYACMGARYEVPAYCTWFASRRWQGAKEGTVRHVHGVWRGLIPPPWHPQLARGRSSVRQVRQVPCCRVRSGLPDSRVLGCTGRAGGRASHEWQVPRSCVSGPGPARPCFLRRLGCFALLLGRFTTLLCLALALRCATALHPSVLAPNALPVCQGAVSSPKPAALRAARWLARPLATMLVNSSLHRGGLAKSRLPRLNLTRGPCGRATGKQASK